MIIKIFWHKWKRTKHSQITFNYFEICFLWQTIVNFKMAHDLHWPWSRNFKRFELGHQNVNYFSVEFQYEKGFNSYLNKLLIRLKRRKKSSICCHGLFNLFVFSKIKIKLSWILLLFSFYGVLIVAFDSF